MKSSQSKQFSTFWGLSIATSPFLVSFLLLSFLSELMIEFGKASEEMFRSERLPVLDFTDFKR